MSRVFIIGCGLILMLLTSGAMAEEDQLDFRTVDKLTYQYYMEQEWDSVIFIGKKALKADIDYFYLRLRMGISYYNLGNYSSALIHLKKAEAFNSADKTTREYLYYSYLYLNRKYEAQAYSSGRSSPATKKDRSSQIIQEVNADFGYTFSNNINKNEDLNIIGLDSLYGHQLLNGNMSFGNLGFTFAPGKNIRLFLSGGYLMLDRKNRFHYAELRRTGRTITQWGYQNEFDVILTDTAFDYQLKQQEFYISSEIYIGAGVELIPYYHYLYATSPLYKYNLKEIRDTNWYTSYNNHYEPIFYDKSVFEAASMEINDYLIGLAIEINRPYFRLGMEGNYSQIGRGRYQQTQLNLESTYYPLGNLNLYGTTTFRGIVETDTLNGNSAENRIIFEQHIGARIHKNAWFEASVIYGNLARTSRNRGFLIYNNTDDTKYKIGLSIIALLSRNIELTLRYQFDEKEASYFTLMSGDQLENSLQLYNYNYQNHSIIGGLTWKF